MNKAIIIWLILFFGISRQAFAKAGYADDGFEFILVIVGFLILAVGITAGMDYLKKNGRNLIHSFKAFLRREDCNR